MTGRKSGAACEWIDRAALPWRVPLRKGGPTIAESLNWANVYRGLTFARPRPRQRRGGAGAAVRWGSRPAVSRNLSRRWKSTELFVLLFSPQDRRALAGPSGRARPGGRRRGSIPFARCRRARLAGGAGCFMRGRPSLQCRSAYSWARAGGSFTFSRGQYTSEAPIAQPRSTEKHIRRERFRETAMAGSNSAPVQWLRVGRGCHVGRERGPGSRVTHVGGGRGSRAPSDEPSRVSYPVSDSMYYIRQARVSRPRRRPALRVAAQILDQVPPPRAVNTRSTGRFTTGSALAQAPRSSWRVPRSRTHRSRQAGRVPFCLLSAAASQHPSILGRVR